MTTVLIACIGANPAVVALQGPAYDASTYGGATAWPPRKWSWSLSNRTSALTMPNKSESLRKK